MGKGPNIAFATRPEADDVESSTHAARKGLFARALAQGYLLRSELDGTLPASALTDSERWLLLYSLKAAGIEVCDARPQVRALRKK